MKNIKQYKDIWHKSKMIPELTKFGKQQHCD